MNRKMSCASVLAACGALWVLAGCASVDMVKTGRGYTAPTNPNFVDVLRTVPQGRTYTELGSLTASGYSVGDTGKMYNGLRARGGDLGADAVIITASGIRYHSYRADTQWAQAVAIKWNK